MLLVVAFHARVPGFGGGYVGVDVFFVISGFLITRLLLRELKDTGRIDFLHFYARRSRRIIPALALLLAAMAALVWPSLSIAYERRGLALSVIAASLFSANILFYLRGQDYFADTDRPDLLTHTWSLSVEEQFYLVWPAAIAFIALVFRRNARALVTFIALICAASFAAAVLHGDPDWVFYLPFSRLWELGLGGILAWLFEHGRWRAFGAALGALGVVAVVASGLIISVAGARQPATLLLPTIGTAAVLMSIEARPDNGAVRWLGHPVLEGIGKVSYGWYLWHFPLLLFAAQYHTPWATAAAVVLSFGIAVLSYRLVEQPIRSRRRWFRLGDRASLAGMVAVLALLVTTGGWLRYRASESPDLFVGRRSEVVWLRARCPDLSLPDAMGGQVCPLGSATPGGPRLHVIGDSHASRFLELFDAFGKANGVAITVSYVSGCTPLIGYDFPFSRDPRRCRRSVDSVFAETLREDAKAGVVLIARWTQAFGSPPRDTAAQQAFTVFPASKWAADVAARTHEALRQTTATLRAGGARVLVVGQAPEWIGNPRKCNPATQDCAEDIGLIRAHSAVSRRALQSVASDRVHFVDLIPAFCDDRKCRAIRNGRLAYDDAHHLSIRGATSLMNELLDELLWVSGTDTVQRPKS